MSHIEEKKGVVKGYWSGVFRAAIVALLILAQFGAIIGLSLWLTKYTVYVYLIIEISSILIMIGLVNGKRSPSFKISWICVILVLPLTGHIMYALWGKSGSKKSIEAKILSNLRHGTEFYEYNPDTVRQFETQYPTKSRIVRSMEASSFPLFQNNSVTYFPMGDETFEAIFDDMEKAERFILINFYIVGEGVLWNQMFDLMKKKCSQGVEVLFLYDDFGAMFRTSKNFKKKLESAGIQVRVFNPVHRYTEKLYMNYRDHQKIVVIDGNVGYTGGMNIADEYVNLVKRFGTWKDNAVRIEGEAAWGFTVTFLQMWEVSSFGPRIDYLPYRPNKTFSKNDTFCQIISDGPANNPKNPIVSIYKQIMFYAKKYLYITTPYLIIEDEIKDALILAVKSGIDVRLITPSIPDKKSVKLLTDFNYGGLLEAGVRIYEYSPGFIHAKTIISEDCGIVGTINMDYRSFYLHYECGAFICNRDVIDTVKKDLIETMSISREITYDEWLSRPFSVKVKQQILNLFATLM